jgi:hypothetical protein
MHCAGRSHHNQAEVSPERPVLLSVGDWTAMRASEGWPRRLLATFVVEADHEIISAFLDDDVPAADLPRARVETDFRAKTLAVSFPVGTSSEVIERWSAFLGSAPIVQNVRGV